MARKHTKESARKQIIGSKEEPIIDLENYNISLALALNFYNNTLTPAEYKSSALDFADSIGKPVSKSIPEFEFRSIGAVCRLILREQPIKVEHIQQVVDKLNLIVKNNLEREPKPEIKIIPVSKPKEYRAELTDFLAEIEDNLIDAIIHKINTLQTVDYYVSKYAQNQFVRDEISQINNLLSKKTTELTKVYNEMKSKSTCQQFNEVWKDIPSTRIKKALAELELLKAGIQNLVKVEQKTKFVAKKKEKPALAQVKNIQYTKKYENIEGLHPKSVIGATEVWIFDTETRDLHVLRAIQGTKFEADGQSFKNVDDSKSIKKKLRKPIEQLNSFINCVENRTRKLYKEIFDEIKSTEQKTSGRMNEHRIILHVFK